MKTKLLIVIAVLVGLLVVERGMNMYFQSQQKQEEIRIADEKRRWDDSNALRDAQAHAEQSHQQTEENIKKIQADTEARLQAIKNRK